LQKLKSSSSISTQKDDLAAKVPQLCMHVRRQFTTSFKFNDNHWFSFFQNQQKSWIWTTLINQHHLFDHAKSLYVEDYFVSSKILSHPTKPNEFDWSASSADLNHRNILLENTCKSNLVAYLHKTHDLGQNQNPSFNLYCGKGNW
jgi:hypothetical protein